MGISGIQFRAFTKLEAQRGKIPVAGTRRSRVGADGSTKDYIVVKFNATATQINGSMITIDGDAVATLGTAGGPALTVGGRAGILAIASATTTNTQTVSGTNFAWAQIYGKTWVRWGATNSGSILGNMLQFGADGVAVAGAAGSASAQLNGVQSMTASIQAAGLFPVLLTYPKFQGSPA
jgi:hypothetical protein